MEHMADIMQEVMGTLSEVSRSEVVVGEGVELGKHKVVPLSRISFGFGGGGGEGEGDHCHHQGKQQGPEGGKGTGGGVGGGVKVRPVGVIVFNEHGVDVQPIPDRKGTLDKVFDKVPDLIDLIKSKCEDK